jgi:hypothetical protein
VSTLMNDKNRIADEKNMLEIMSLLRILLLVCCLKWDGKSHLPHLRSF